MKGLSKAEVIERVEKGQVNYDTTVKTKTIKQIVRDNALTPFNCLNFFLAALILLVRSYKNLLFMGVVISNSVISIIQEIRSKKAVDKLSIIASKKATVIRDGKETEIDINEIVLDDILLLNAGDQIVVDSKVIKGECEVNESFITGESDPIYKKVGEELLSGSFVMSGKVTVQVLHVGVENYAAKISQDAKKKKQLNSEIMKTLNKIVKLISMIILPLGMLLFWRQMTLPDATFPQAVVSTVAALIVMIPEGLVLLTSVVLAVSVLRLAKHQVLVQDLYCIETLARVDTICLDKTGTLTEGTMEVSEIVPVGDHTLEEVTESLREFSCASTDQNATMEAIRSYFHCDGTWKVEQVIPFSSDKKYSGVVFENHSYLLGAPDFLGHLTDSLKEQVTIFSKEHRIVALFQTKEKLERKKIPDHLELLGFVLLKDKIRKEARRTLNYFKRQGVTIKIISGDHVSTVRNIACQLQIPNYEKAIDLSAIAEEQYDSIVEEYTIFGRVTPLQKQKLIQSLKRKGHTVAMTGDGVNDVLALKEANCSIAMAAGSEAARNVSELVLLDNNFDAMPQVVAEGRRSINNIERSSTLFLSKTIYATLLAIFFLFVSIPYPFMPIQLTLISTATIGIPSFILALEPNHERVKGNFFRNILYQSLPTALTVFLMNLVLSLLSHYQVFAQITISTMSVLVTGFIGFLLLYRLCQPFDWIRRCLFYGTILFFGIQFIFLQDLYSLGGCDWIMASCSILLIVLAFYIHRYISKGICYALDHGKVFQKILEH